MSANLTIDPNIDSSFYIFDYLFKCRIPNLLSMSPDYIKIFGTPTTGNKQVDKALANELITTMLPISKMVEYHKDGVPIYISHHNDVKTIYDCISNHLYKWKDKIQKGINIGGAPIDDLIAMDEFANSVYEHAKFQFTRGIADNMMLKHLSSVVKLNRNNFFKDSPLNTAPSEESKEEVIPQRQSLSKLFQDRLVGTKVWN